MKTYALFITFYIISFAPSQANVINGYERDVENARTSLRHLLNLPEDKSVIKRLQAVREFMLYYELTEYLLAEFKLISPSLYQQIDTITDLKGRPVDVYVKFVPKSDVQPGTMATTNINQQENDKHAYVSEYGANTASTKITIVKHSLLILAHEFGHVSYQVPNLADYVDFFSTQYRDHIMKAAYLGHKPNDPSGQMAEAFERKFRLAHAKYADYRNHSHPDPLKLRDQMAKTLDEKFSAPATIPHQQTIAW